jgi:hypothetical protein
MIVRFVIIGACVAIALGGGAAGRRWWSHDLLVRYQAFTGITDTRPGSARGTTDCRSIRPPLIRFT